MRLTVRPGTDPVARADATLLAAMGLPGGGVARLGRTHVLVRPDPAGPIPTLQWRHLSGYLGSHVSEPTLALLGIPNSTGYFFANFAAFEPGGIDAAQYQAALAGMRAVQAAAPRARLLMMLVPASVQVCEPEALDYYPANIDLAAFDFEQPQRLASALAREIGAEVLDLRPALAAAGCPYQRANMHWLEQGHQIAATALIQWLGSPSA